mgnify:CR=1 FL=1
MARMEEHDPHLAPEDDGQAGEESKEQVSCRVRGEEKDEEEGGREKVYQQNRP